MAGFLAKLRALLLREEAGPEPTPEQAARAAAALGAEFRRKHTNFRLLLTSGKRLLSILADMEHAKTDGRVFGMVFLRAGTTSAAVNAFRMLSHLKTLDAGAAERLSARFAAILAEVEAVLGRRKAPACGELVTDLCRVDAAAADQVGARLAELGEVKNRLGLPVPEGFAIGACAYEAFAGQEGLREEIARRMQSVYASAASDADAAPALFGPDAHSLALMSREIQDLIMAAPLPEALEKALTQACEVLAAACGCTHLCLLPCTMGEGQGFTGVYPAQFGVPCAGLLDAYRRALAGKYSVQAMRRRLMRGIQDIDVALCVGVLAVPGPEPGADPELDQALVPDWSAERLRGACRSTDPEDSARVAGLTPEEARGLAE
ncbi:MAG: PEP/pyruvate-binding domain-containing protein, partial [Proteobacteria bacterium]|nr:PEP/pyruvate-binding domain-containing protein [Pseudomonadota bacterium]